MTELSPNPVADTDPSAPVLLAAVLDAVGYLRIRARRDADPDTDWLRCRDLVSDPRHLLHVVRGTAEGRGTTRDDIALSLFVQAYAFRIAATSIGGWLLSGGRVSLDVAPATTAVALARHRPSSVALDRVVLADRPLGRSLFDDHLRPLVDTAHEAAAGGARPVGRALLWGNVAAACAAAFGSFHGADRAERAAVRAAADRFLAEVAPLEVARAGRFVTFTGRHPEPGWFWERSSCCLWYQTRSEAGQQGQVMCQDCSLWSDDDRLTRYRAATGEERP